MTMRSLRWPIVVGVLIALSGLVIPLSGQQIGSDDTLKALLVELRGIRVAMEQMTSSGPRVQLALGRLQLQEQRVNTMLRQLDAVRERKASAEHELVGTREQLSQMEDATERSQDPEERKALAAQGRTLAAMLEQGTADVQRLASEESQLSRAIATEQARWSDINRQLEELERALVR